VPGRDQREQPERGAEVGGQGLEIAVVHADHARADGERLLQLGGGVRLHERVHAHALGRLMEIAEGAAIERGHDEQGGVGAGGARLPELILVDGEVLSQ
jgi:hypothetical protein